jgi:thiol-disulfide isomerase/thioredoxin
MNRLLLAAVSLCVFASVARAADPPREASEILKEYASVKMPAVDATRVRDPDYVRSYFEERKKALQKQGDLALELYRGHPGHPRAVELMIERWSNMAAPPTPRIEESIVEMEKFLKERPESPGKNDVLFQRAAATEQSERTAAQKDQTIDDFLKAAPKDERGAELLAMTAERADDPAAKLRVLRRIVADYAGTFSAKMAAGTIRQVEGIGKPFELNFKDAIGGEPIAMKDLKGKVVVVDFWATWCGPCVAEMPKMKELYAKYKPQGVEFIGVSLDQPESEGGLSKLKAFVKENDITWPQYFQGEGWQSEFSGSWGINGIPTVFVVDTAGNLYSTEARGELEEMIPQLLKKRER